MNWRSLICPPIRLRGRLLDPGRPCAGPGLGREAVQPRQNPRVGAQASARQPLRLSYHGPRMGARHLQDVRPSALCLQIIINGHEYVARQAQQEQLSFTKEDNCFTIVADGAQLARVADTLCSENTVGHLSQLCDRWAYSACLCFALDLAEQQQSGFHYDYSLYQVEYSRNLLFASGHTLDQVFQGVVERTRGPLDLKTLKTIFGAARPRRRALSPDRVWRPCSRHLRMI